MGPRSDERGKGKAQACGGVYQKASMGPRSDERGKRVGVEAGILQHSQLQWGRVRMNAERASKPTLQCGQWTCFNGAAFG